MFGRAPLYSTLKHPNRKHEHKFPKKLFKEFDVTFSKYDKCVCYSISKKGNAKSKKHLIYLHGGAYAMQIVHWQWKTVHKIAKKSNVTIDVFIYELSNPNHTVYKQNFDALEKFYDTLDGNWISILGDSAGGGMAVSFSKYLRDKKKKLPNHLFLVDPWINMVDNGHLTKKDFNEKDTYLKYDDCQTSIEWYTHGEDPHGWMFSPLYVDFKGFPPVLLIISTHEIIYNDLKTFYEKLKGSHVDVTKMTYKELFHDFFLFDIEESDEVLDKICGIINKS